MEEVETAGHGGEIGEKEEARGNGEVRGGKRAGHRGRGSVRKRKPERGDSEGAIEGDPESVEKTSETGVERDRGSEELGRMESHS